MGFSVPLLLLLGFSLVLDYNDSGYEYKRPSHPFLLPQSAPPKTFVHQELASEQAPHRRGHVQRHKLRYGAVQPKERHYFGGYSSCQHDTQAFESLLEAQRLARPEDRRLTPYTEVQVDAEYFEPAEIKAELLKNLLLSGAEMSFK